MQVNPTMGMIYAQMTYTSRVASDAVTGPEAALAMSKVIAEEMSKLEQTQVQASEACVEARIANDEDFKDGASKENMQQRQGHEHEQEEIEELPSENPFVGNLLNIKV